MKSESLTANLGCPGTLYFTRGGTWTLLMMRTVRGTTWSFYLFGLGLAAWCKEPTHLKRPWCWERLKAGGEGDDRGWDGWMSSPTQCTWVWGKPWELVMDKASYSPQGHRELDTTEGLDWTEPLDELSVAVVISPLIKNRQFCVF